MGFVGNELTLGRDIFLVLLAAYLFMCHYGQWAIRNTFGRNPFKSYGDYEVVSTDTIL